mgnify:CR=1 FL=1
MCLLIVTVGRCSHTLSQHGGLYNGRELACADLQNKEIQFRAPMMNDGGVIMLQIIPRDYDVCDECDPDPWTGGARVQMTVQSQTELNEAALPFDVSCVVSGDLIDCSVEGNGNEFNPVVDDEMNDEQHYIVLVSFETDAACDLTTTSLSVRNTTAAFVRSFQDPRDVEEGLKDPDWPKLKDISMDVVAGAFLGCGVEQTGQFNFDAVGGAAILLDHDAAGINVNYTGGAVVAKTIRAPSIEVEMVGGFTHVEEAYDDFYGAFELTCPDDDMHTRYRCTTPAGEECDPSLVTELVDDAELGWGLKGFVGADEVGTDSLSVHYRGGGQADLIIREDRAAVLEDLGFRNLFRGIITGLVVVTAAFFAVVCCPGCFCCCCQCCCVAPMQKKRAKKLQQMRSQPMQPVMSQPMYYR